MRVKVRFPCSPRPLGRARQEIVRRPGSSIPPDDPEDAGDEPADEQPGS